MLCGLCTFALGAHESIHEGIEAKGGLDLFAVVDERSDFACQNGDIAFVQALECAGMAVFFDCLPLESDGDELLVERRYLPVDGVDEFGAQALMVLVRKS